MNKNEIDILYSKISEMHDKFLKQYNVKLPNLKVKNKYTLNALVLIYLYKKIGKIVSKQELTEFLKNMGYKINDVQQARHLAQQSGWYILSGTRGDLECQNLNVKAGQYLLKTIEKPYPSYQNLKRTETLKANSWNELKKIYNNRCATCGSKEGEYNFLYPASITTLQQGHKDPGKSLTIENTIPQCQFCNRASRNYFVFDNKGRVEKIYDPNFILKSDKNIQKVMLQILIEHDLKLAKQIIKKIESGN